MGYKVIQIDQEESDRLYEEYHKRKYYTSKADISGICVKLYTEDRNIKDMWEDNFYSMGFNTKSHARLITLNDPDREMCVLYDRSTFTAFLFNFDYYGWIKSIALAIASDILEDSHRIYSVHGAALDVDGTGVTLIAPSKTGKTTQSWGLLRADNTRLITDDWYFVRLTGGRPQINGSEKNCYIDADIGDVWEEFKPLVSSTVFDNKGRGIANVRWITGNESVVPMAALKHVIFLKRDYDDPEIIKKLDTDEALEYIVSNDFCNPHQMVRDERKMAIREEFFRKFLDECEVHLVNTRCPARETQEKIREVIGIKP